MELISYYQTSIQNIYNRINGLYSEAAPFFDEEVSPPDLDLIDFDNSIGKLNRAFYDWTVNCINQLQSVMNTVVIDFNDNGIVDEDIGDTPTIELWIPERTAVDDIYMNNLENDFDESNKLIDNLIDYTKEFENY